MKIGEVKGARGGGNLILTKAVVATSKKNNQSRTSTSNHQDSHKLAAEEPGALAHAWSLSTTKTGAG